MSWFKVDDRMFCNAKFVGLSPAATSLWLRAGSWAAGQETHGEVPANILPLLCGDPEIAQELVDAGLWEIVAVPSLSSSLATKTATWKFHNWERIYAPTETESALRKKHQLGAAKTNAKRWGTTAPEFPKGEDTTLGSIASDIAQRVASQSLSESLSGIHTNTNTIPVLKKENSKEKNFGSDSQPTDRAPGSLLDEPYTADFEQLWAVYPRKTGKREAFKAWKQAGANRPALPLLLAKAVAYAASREVVEGFSLNASRWIRERRWEDQPEPASTAPQRPSGVGMSRIEANLEHNRQLVARYEAEEAAQQARQAKNGSSVGVGVVPPLKLLSGRRVA